MTSDPGTAGAPAKSTAIALLAFAIGVPVVLFQVKSEGLQVAVALLAAFGLGFYLGHGRSARARVGYLGLAAAAGLLTWLVIMVSSLVFFPGAAAYPIGTWFVRFGVGITLITLGGALLGDAAATGKHKTPLSTVANVVTIVGGVFALFLG